MVKWLERIGLLFCVMFGMSVGGCRGGRPTTPSVTPQSETRSARWVQTSVADFRAGESQGVTITDVAGGEVQLAPLMAGGVYTAPVVTADFAFTGLVAYWQADLPAESEIQVEMRYETAEGWSPWYALPNVERSPEVNVFYPETPLLVVGGLKFQYRATLRAGDEGQSPRLDEITVVYLDTSVGPTTVQARSMARMQSATVQGVPGPTIITRAGWGADESYRTWAPEYRPVSKIVIHHTVTPNGYSEAQGAAWVRAIYYYHAVTLGWGDIGYNYLVDQYGNLYEGRYGGPGVVGGHVYGYNYGTVGVAVIGTYGNYADSVSPNLQTKNALVNLAAWESSRSVIHPLQKAFFRDAVIPNLGGHRDYPPYTTSCPGDLLYATLDTLRQSVWERMKTYMPQYDVAWLAWNGLPGTTLQAGQTYSLSVQVRNLGWQTWPLGGDHPVRVGYHWLDERGQPAVQPSEDDHRTPLTVNLAFGEVYAWEQVPVTTPRTPGTWTLVMDMVHEGITWFHDANRNSSVLSVQVTVVGTPTATPAPTPDSGLLQNGSFEYDGGWTIFETAYPARYVEQVARSGRRALQTGIPQAGANVYTYSSAEQSLRLPTTGRIVLSYWYRAQIDGDYAYVYLYTPDTGWRPLRIVRESTTEWTYVEHDLSVYAGQNVTVRLGTFNDGRGGVSAMYVDDVSVRVDTASPTPPPPPTSTPTPTWTPTPLPTPTWTPTPLPTPTWTPTPLPTPTFTPAPAVPACREQAINGDFEGEDGWIIANTPYKARYSTAVARTGARSLQLGIADLTQNQFTYSSVEQRFAIPSGYKATLELWYQMPNSGGSGDYGYFLIQPDGGTWRTLRIVNERVTGWTRLQVDVSHYAGSAFTLRLGVRNDGTGDGAAAVMYVDSLSVQVCR